MALQKKQKQNTVDPRVVAGKMEEVSGAGGGGVPGYAGNAWVKKQKRDEELTK